MSRADKRAQRAAEHTRWKQYRGKACVVCGAEKQTTEGELVEVTGWHDIHAARLLNFKTEWAFACDKHCDDDDRIRAALEALALQIDHPYEPATIQTQDGPQVVCVHILADGSPCGFPQAEHTEAPA